MIMDVMDWDLGLPSMTVEYECCRHHPVINLPMAFDDLP